MATITPETFVNKIEKLSALLEITKSMGGERDLEALLVLITEATSRVMHAERSTLLLLDHDRGELWSKVAQELEIKEIRIPLNQGIAGHVTRTGRTVNITDAYQDPRFDEQVDSRTGYFTRTMLCVPMKNQLAETIGVFQVLNKKDGAFESDDEELLAAFASQAAVAVETAQLYEDLKNQFRSSIEVMAASIDARDPYTAGHSERVVEYSLGIGKQIGLDAKEMEVLRLSALLHDYGKIGTDDAILRKPGKLSPEEFAHIKSHAAKTHALVSRMYFSRDFAQVPDIASSHHEKLDGSGYPLGLANGQIPRAGRIIAVADVFDAVTSNRPYRQPFDLEGAFDILEKTKGHHLEASLVDAFRRYYLVKDKSAEKI